MILTAFLLATPVAANNIGVEYKDLNNDGVKETKVITKGTSKTFEVDKDSDKKVDYLFEYKSEIKDKERVNTLELYIESKESPNIRLVHKHNLQNTRLLEQTLEMDFDGDGTIDYNNKYKYLNWNKQNQIMGEKLEIDQMNDGKLDTIITYTYGRDKKGRIIIEKKEIVKQRDKKVFKTKLKRNSQGQIYSLERELIESYYNGKEQKSISKSSSIFVTDDEGNILGEELELINSFDINGEEFYRLIKLKILHGEYRQLHKFRLPIPCDEDGVYLLEFKCFDKEDKEIKIEGEEKMLVLSSLQELECPLVKTQINYYDSVDKRHNKSILELIEENIKSRL